MEAAKDSQSNANESPAKLNGLDKDGNLMTPQPKLDGTVD
jgi:hypothetical protein